MTYDEGESDAGCCGIASGGRIATVIAGPDVRRHASGGTYYHYSTLATIEDAFGVSRLGNARGARSFAPLFKRGPHIGRGSG